MSGKIRILSRASQLARRQAQLVEQLLNYHHPSLQVEQIFIKSEGDLKPQAALADLGGKQVFVKTLQQALLRGEADIAVHSVKDLAVKSPQGLRLACVLRRADARDVLISRQGITQLAQLPAAARVATSSPRRASQLLLAYPKLQPVPIRGNVDSRLAQLAAGEYDAMILAAAGLQRLNLTQHIAAYLDKQQFLPAIGQGAIGIESRCQDLASQALLKPLEDTITRLCVTAEQAVNQILGGGCHTPIAAHAEYDAQYHSLHLSAMVAALDGSSEIRVEGDAPASLTEAQALGQRLARQLQQQGASKLLDGLGL